MAERGTAQNYGNHSRAPLALALETLLLLIGAAIGIAGVYLEMPSLFAFSLAVVAVASVTVGITARHNATTLQDRIIRLEMELRLARVLPDDLRRRIPELDLGQRIALRFASDEELPALTRQALEGALPTPDAIKRAVKHWQADHLRV